MKHVSLPLLVERGSGRAVYLHESGAGPLCCLYMLGEEGYSKAREIARAVNTHDTLIDACEAFVTDRRFYKTEHEEWGYTCLACGAWGETMETVRHKDTCIIAQGQAALAKARGEDA